MELSINIENKKVIVPSDIAVNIQNQESFLWRNQRGERTFPFRLAWTPILRSIYGYIEQVNFLRLSSYAKIATLLADNYLCTEGNLVVTDASEDYIQLEFRVPPGNISAMVWNKKLRECDFGKETVPTTTTTLFLWKKATINLPYTLTQSSSIVGHVQYYKAAILINNSVVASAKLYYSNVVNNTDGSKTVSFSPQNFIDCLKECVSRNSSDYEIYQTDGILYVRLNNTTDTVVFNFYRETNEAPYTPFAFSSHNYQSVGNYYDKYINPDIPLSPVVLPIVSNYSFYADNASASINAREGGHILLNTESEPTQNVLMPALTLHFLLEKVMQQIGYTLAGSLPNDTDLKYACIITNTAAARPLTGTTTFDIFANELEYAHFAPDFTIKEFFDYLFDQLGVVANWDTTQKIINTKFVDEIINSSSIRTISSLAKAKKVRLTESKNIWLKWQGVDEKIEQYFPYPTTEPENSETIELRFPPIYINEGNYELIGEGVTPIFSQQNNSPIVRLFFAGANGVVSNSRGNWNIALTGPNNLYQKVFGPQEKYLNSPEYEYSTIMKVSEVLQLSATDKLNIDGVNCFRKEIQYKLQANINYVDVQLTIVTT